MFLPDDVVGEFYHGVPGGYPSPGYGGWIFDCDAALPDFRLEIENGFEVVVPGEYLNYAANGDGSKCMLGLPHRRPWQTIPILSELIIHTIAFNDPPFTNELQRVLAPYSPAMRLRLHLQSTATRC